MTFLNFYLPLLILLLLSLVLIIKIVIIIKTIKQKERIIFSDFADILFLIGVFLISGLVLILP